MLSAISTDLSTENTRKLGVLVANNLGVVSSTNRTLADTGQAMTPSRYRNYRLFITGGTGAGQNKRIINNTATVFTVPQNWDTNPDNTSTYEVWPNTDRMYLVGGANAATYSYSPENDNWMQGHAFDDGVTCNISATMKSWLPVGVTSGTRIAAGVVSINPVPTAGGTGYVLGDVLTCAVGGAGAQVTVTGIGSNGVITTMQLSHAGTATGYTTGTGKATTGGTGTAATIEITAIGATALINTATNHWFDIGKVITFAGLNEGAWNAAHTVIGVNGINSFSVATTATLSMVPTTAQTTTTVYDPTKGWIVNEHVGRLVHVMVAGTAPTSQIRWITANTATTLTIAAITTAVNGTTKYVIYDSKIFGIDDQRKEDTMVGYGMATGGTTTTLIDTTKTWIPDQYKNYLFKIEAGIGYGSGRIVITSNTSTTLTYSTQSFTPDASTTYEIADSWGLITTGGTTTPVTEITSKNWAVNQWAGKRFKITGGNGVGQETSVISNTSNALTSSALATTDITSTYAIMSNQVRNAGMHLMFAYNLTNLAKRGKYLICGKGGGLAGFDLFDITLGRWIFGLAPNPQSELLNIGSSYCYDGNDNIYFSRSVANAPIRVMKYNINTNKMYGAGTTGFSQNAVHVGNLMEVVKSLDGYPFLFTIQNTGTLVTRALMF
jgi:hypothetical protein